MDEIAAKHVLLDFELISLIALALGVIVYAVAKRFRRDKSPGDSVDFDGFDLVLMFFPAILFLLNPIVEAVSASSKSKGGNTEVGNGIGSILVNLGTFAFIGVMTFGTIEWVRNRRADELFGLRRLTLPKIIVISILGGVTALVICAKRVGDFSNDS
jgi:hypothetical protein